MIAGILVSRNFNLKKKTAKEFCSPCPFCGGEDRFCIWPQDNRAWCRRCGWAGDDIQLVMDFDNIGFKEAAEKCRRTDKIIYNPPTNKPGKLTETYNYVNEQGKLLYQVLRFEPKTFSQRRPGIKTRWIYNLDGIRRVLYRLPQIIESQEVVFVEGEKDADAVVKALKLPATCNPGGADKIKGQQANYGILDPLKGKSVFVVPDNDEPGRKHAQDVAELLYGIAKEVRIIELDVPAKGDISDWLTRFDDPVEAQERLSILIEGTSPYEPPKKASESADDIISQVPKGIFIDYLDYVAKFSEAPLEFHLFTLAYIISSIIGRNRFIQQGEDTIYANQYTMLVAPSSLFKKSSSGGLSTKFLSRLGLQGHYLGKIGSPEGLFAGLKEGLGMGFFYYSELGLLLAQANKKYMGADVLEILNDLYDCPDYYPKRLSERLHKLENVFVNLLCATQLNSLTEHIRQHVLLSGFLPRFTVVYSENKRPHLVNRPEPDKTLQNKILIQLQRILKETQSTKKLTLNPEAWEIFEAWGQERYKDAEVAPPQIQPLYGRIETHVLKFSIIIGTALDPSSEIIKKGIIGTAITWGNYVLRSYRQLVLEELTFNESDRRLKRVEDIIKSSGSASHRDVARGTRYRQKDLEEFIQTLAVMGKIKISKGSRGGKVYDWIR